MAPKDRDQGGAASRYDALIEAVFFENYTDGSKTVPFSRPEFEAFARKLKIKLPKNIGDIVYTYRYRKQLPRGVRDTAGKGEEWIIEEVGSAKYVFRRVKGSRITPLEGRFRIKIPDATPEIVFKHALTDEQAILATVRYNRLVDLFLQINAYSLENHLRTHVKAIGQIEIDELYVGVNKNGAQFIVPVQAKAVKESIGVVQIVQDLAFCKERFPALIARAVAAKALDTNVIALFELTLAQDQVRVVEERHYELVAADDISEKELKAMRRNAEDDRK